MSVAAVQPNYDYSFLPAPMERCAQIVVPLIGPAAGLYYAAYGLVETAKELWCLCGPKHDAISHTNDNPTLWERIAVLLTAENCPHIFHAVHGILFVGSGLCQVFSGLHDLQVLPLGTLYPAMLYGGMGLLVGAHLYGMFHFANQFWEAHQAEGAAVDDMAKDTARQQKIAAFLSLVGTVAYFISAVIALFEPMAAAVLIFAALGLLTTSVYVLWLGYQMLTKE